MIGSGNADGRSCAAIVYLLFSVIPRGPVAPVKTMSRGSRMKFTILNAIFAAASKTKS